MCESCGIEIKRLESPNVNVEPSYRLFVPELLSQLIPTTALLNNKGALEKTACSLYEYLGMLINGCEDYSALLDVLDNDMPVSNCEVTIISIKGIFVPYQLCFLLSSLR